MPRRGVYVMRPVTINLNIIGGDAIKQKLRREGYPVARQPVVSDVVSAISPASFWVPDYICPSAWIEHAPFAFWVCETLRPRCFVELGTQFGYSYFAFCQ